jgi:hypothetical protein|tara:strand:+ start:1607 stop:1942 length:336 start_codon:yes stop_codon:yes gene_type:complete
MSEAPELLLQHHLKTLKLPTVLREYAKLASQCAAEGLDHVQFLARLVELELIDRERRMPLSDASIACRLTDRAAYQGSEVPGRQKSRQLRLQGDPQPQQDAGAGTGAMRMD